MRTIYINLYDDLSIVAQTELEVTISVKLIC